MVALILDQVLEPAAEVEAAVGVVEPEVTGSTEAFGGPDDKSCSSYSS